VGPNFRFGGGATESVIHPIVLVAMLIAIVLILLLPRRYVIIPVLAMTFLVPLSQQLVVLGVHLFVARIIILAGLARLAATKFGSRLNSLDKAFALWAVFRALASILLFLQVGAFINQAGFLLDALGGYFLLRYLIRDQEDIFRAIKTLSAIALIIGACMVYERAHLVNVFSLLSGKTIVPEVRDGVVRSIGPFEHEILAGVFGATLLPLFLLLWKVGKSRLLAFVGLVAATVITVTSASSTSLLAYVAGLFAVCLWPLRKEMRFLRWGIVLGIVCLQLVMKVPFWWAIQHVHVMDASSSWHRAQLVDEFIRHFFNWCLIGTKDNASWGFQTWDLCNQYVAEGETGGLATLICFIALIVISFKRLGIARKAVEGDRKKELYFWFLGAALFAHVTAYLGISYFDQTRVAWFALLVFICAATAPAMVHELAPEPAPAGLSPSRPLARAGWSLRASPRAGLAPDTRKPLDSQMQAGRSPALRKMLRDK